MATDTFFCSCCCCCCCCCPAFWVLCWQDGLIPKVCIRLCDTILTHTAALAALPRRLSRGVLPSREAARRANSKAPRNVYILDLLGRAGTLPGTLAPGSIPQPRPLPTPLAAVRASPSARRPPIPEARAAHNYMSATQNSTTAPRLARRRSPSLRLWPRSVRDSSRASGWAT